MSDPYEEIVRGESLLRRGPGPRHELVCYRLHDRVASIMGDVRTARLLPPRTLIELSSGTLIRPDLTLLTVATGKAWLIAEVVDAVDHHSDTVIKKGLYEDVRLPRLWMVDPRYNNVEVYHGSPYGLALHRILANRDQLTETLLPDLALAMGDLFED